MGLLRSALRRFPTERAYPAPPPRISHPPLGRTPTGQLFTKGIVVATTGAAAGVPVGSGAVSPSVLIHLVA